MKKILITLSIVSAIALTLVMVYPLTVKAAAEGYLKGSQPAGIVTALQDLYSRKNDFLNYEYIIYQSSSNTSQMIISLFDKSLNNEMEFDHTYDADYDLDRVNVYYYADSTKLRYNYIYVISTGAYVSSSSWSTSGTYTLSPTKYFYYGSMPVKQKVYDATLYPAIYTEYKD